MSPSVSAVVPSRDEGDSLRRTVHSLLATMPADGEVVVVDDGSADGSVDFLNTRYPPVRVVRPDARVGPAVARNLGAEAASGEILVFCDAHVAPQPGWFDAFSEALEGDGVGAVGPAMTSPEQPQVCGYGATWQLPDLHLRWLGYQGPAPHEAPLLGGAFLAMRRSVFEACGGFDAGLIGWGGSDSELCIRLWLLGYSCVVLPTVAVAHGFRKAFPYAVDEALIIHNFLRLAFVHLDADRLEGVIDHYRLHAGAARAFALLAAGDTYERRAAIRAERRHDDAWFFERFRDVENGGPAPTMR
jgi:GT2 family glycosyltransferase